MRQGKMAVQVSRASDRLIQAHYRQELSEKHSLLIEHWIKDEVNKKIVLSCDSIDELITCYRIAEDWDFPRYMVTDLGLTEFDCITTTAIAIGPFHEEVLDAHYRSRPLKLA